MLPDAADAPTRFGLRDALWQRITAALLRHPGVEAVILFGSRAKGTHRPGSDIDLALCMTVFPGFGGQAYIPASTERIRTLRAAIERLNPKCELEVDGGIDRKTIGDAAKAGANVFVAGTAVFGHPSGPTEGTRELIQLAGG